MTPTADRSVKRKLKQPELTNLTYKHIKEHLDKQSLNGGHVPFKSARQFSSIGLATSEQLSISEQRHEYFSELERKFGLVLGFMSNVTNVKTQVPILDVQSTINIATELNLMHPRYEPKASVSDENAGFQAAIMTTDFLFDYIDTSSGEVIFVAVSIKYQSDVICSHGDDRVIQRTHDKFEIEKRYWERVHGRKYLVITCDYWMFNKHLIDNLSVARVHRRMEIPPTLKTSLLVEFHEVLRHDRIVRPRLIDLVHQLSQKTNLSTDRLYAVFWHFVWTKKITLDLFRPINNGEYLFIGEEFAWA